MIRIGSARTDGKHWVSTQAGTGEGSLNRGQFDRLGLSAHSAIGDISSHPSVNAQHHSLPRPEPSSPFGSFLFTIPRLANCALACQGPFRPARFRIERETEYESEAVPRVIRRGNNIHPRCR